jgi:nitrogen regulatory protein PII
MNIDTVYHHGKLLLSIVQSGVGEALVHETKEAGARGGTILIGKGVAEHAILHMLGLGDAEKEIVVTLLQDSHVTAVLDRLAHFRRNKRLACGIAMLIDVPHILTHVLHLEANSLLKESQTRRRPTMDTVHTLITCIVNRGAADEIMDAARAAGATGGTILAARGTGKEEDVKFFGVQLVPEKEMILILVGSGLTGKVLDAIRSVPCLAEPGSGIAFCVDVERFMTLGGKLPSS